MRLEPINPAHPVTNQVRGALMSCCVTSSSFELFFMFSFYIGFLVKVLYIARLKIKEKELTALLEKYTKLQTVYNKEFEQNSKYIEMNSSKLDALGEELKNGLNQFNGILSEVIAKNEKIKNEIREANR